MSAPPDILAAVAWVSSTLLLTWAGWSAAGRLFPADGWAVRLGHAALYGWAAVVAVSFVLGAAGVLRPALLLAGVDAVAVGTLVLAGRRAEPPVRPARGWAIVWGLVGVYTLAHALVGGVYKFPTDWDTLMYHLPLVDCWLQAGSLYAPDCPRWSEPANGELLTLWLVAPFSGDFLFGLTNLVPALVLAVWAVELARGVGAGPVAANLAGLAAASNFIVYRQVTDTGNDVAVAAAFLATLGYAVRYAAARRAADLGFAAVAVGLLAGVKFYALGYAAVAGAVAVGLVWRSMGGRAAARAAAVGAAGALAFGGYWYLRNWAAAGSPFFPLGAPSDGDNVPMTYPCLWATTIVGNGRPEVFRLTVAALWAMTGPVHLLAAALLPVAAVVALAGRSAAGVALVAATLGAGAVWVVTPFCVEDSPGTLNQLEWHYCPIRYGITFLTAAVVLLAVAGSAAGRWLGRVAPARAAGVVRGLAVAAVVAGVGYQTVATHDVRIPVEFPDLALVGVNLAAGGGLAAAVWAVRGWGRAAVVLAAGVGGVVAVADVSERWHAGFVAFYDDMLGNGVFARLDADVPPGTRVCVLDLRPYPFFGPSRQYQVCQPFRARTYPVWSAYVRANGVGYLVGRFDDDGGWRSWQYAREWIDDRPAAFRRVPVDSVYAVYHIDPGRLDAPPAEEPGG